MFLKIGIKKIILAPILPMLILISSCTKSCKDTNVDSKKPINVAVAFAIESLDSRFATSAVAGRVSKLIFAPLFEMGEDIAPNPFLAESIEAIDEKTFKINLRKNLFFHDGTPLTANDVVYTYKGLSDADVLSPHADKFDYLEDIKALDKNTIIFELKRPHAPFLTDLCAIGIVSQSSCQGRSDKCRHEHNGSGPFQLKKWDRAKDMLHLTPFPKWFEGSPKIELVFRVVRDENTRILELMGQKTDLVESDISPQNLLELKKQRHLKIEKLPGLSYSYLALNVRGPRNDEPKDSPLYKTRAALANRSVRKAIAHAIDFEQIIDKVLLNTAERSSGLIPNGHWAKDNSLKPPGFDPAMAEQILDQQGFNKDKDSGVRFNLTILTTPNRVRQSIAQLYADFLQRVGIKASVRVKEWGALYEDMKNGNFEMFSALWVPVTEPDLYYWVHHSSSIPDNEKSGGNRHGYVNKTVDSLIELGRLTMEHEKRKAIYQEIERLLLTDLPYIPLWNEYRIVVSNQERLTGYSPSPTGSLLGLRQAQYKTASN